VSGNRALAKVLTEDPGAWWVTCFAVDSRHRRSGVGSALLKAAVEFAREHGATAVEGHPVDVAALSAARVSGSAIYTGTVAMFSAAGFSEIGRTYPTRPVMRHLV
jgi:GNAT superfamily N-acetyltransferase